MKPMRYNSCEGCVAPKRHPGCHSTCPDHIIDKAFHEAEKAEERRKREAACYSYDQLRDRKATLAKRRSAYRRYNRGNIQ